MQSTKSGVGFLGLLTILFIGLKLGGVIQWSWLLVLLPLYIIPLMFVVAAAIFAIGTLAINTFSNNGDKK